MEAPDKPTLLPAYAAFALMLSITFRIPAHTVISVNISTTLP